MPLFKIETQSDSALVEINTDDKEKIKDLLREFLNDRNYYYVDGLLTLLQEKGFKTKKIIPIDIHWWEIQPIKDIDKIVENC